MSVNAGVNLVHRGSLGYAVVCMPFCAYRGVALAGFVVGRLAARGLARCSDGSRSPQAFPNGSDSVRWVVHDRKRVAKCFGEF
jgi:hypothetical protein